MFTGARVKNAGTSFFQPFRKDFGSLSTLRSFCAGIIKNVYTICDYACIILVWGCAEMLTFSFFNGSIPDSLHTSFTVKEHLQMLLVLKCWAT